MYKDNTFTINTKENMKPSSTPKHDESAKKEADEFGYELGTKEEAEKKYGIGNFIHGFLQIVEDGKEMLYGAFKSKE